LLCRGILKKDISRGGLWRRKPGKNEEKRSKKVWGGTKVQRIEDGKKRGGKLRKIVPKERPQKISEKKRQKGITDQSKGE